MAVGAGLVAVPIGLASGVQRGWGWGLLVGSVVFVLGWGLRVLLDERRPSVRWAPLLVAIPVLAFLAVAAA